MAKFKNKSLSFNVRFKYKFKLRYMNDLKKHSTIIIAWNASGGVEYCRTFDYDKEKDSAQAVYSFVSQNYPHWVMSEVGHYLPMNKFKE